MPCGEAAKLLMPAVFVIAAVLIVHEGGPDEQTVPVLVLLATVALGAFIAPLADAAVARASERRADAFAARMGWGPDLAAALDLVAPSPSVGPLARMRNTHPNTRSRVKLLLWKPASP